MLKKLSGFIGFLLIHVTLCSQQPIFSVQALFGPTWYAMDDYFETESSQNFNYSAGGYLMVNFPSRKNFVSLRLGYFYDTKNYVIENLYIDDYPEATKRKERSFGYGNVPLLLEFRFNIKDRYYPFISPGVIFGWVQSAEQTYVRVNGETFTGFPSRSNIQQKQTDFHVCTGINYRLNRHILLRLELFVSQQFNTDTHYNRDVFGFFSYGIKTGIQFDLYLPEEKNK